MPETKKPKQPEDHQPKADARPKTQTVTLDGHDYQIDPARMDDLSVLELIEDEKWIGVLRAVLGPEQWAAFKTNHADEQGRVTGAKFSAILDELNAAGGLGN